MLGEPFFSNPTDYADNLIKPANDDSNASEHLFEIGQIFDSFGC
jgi:hypothetical protein